MGGSNTRRLMSQNIVAICDVDDALVDAQLKRMGTTRRVAGLAAAAAAADRRANMSKAQAAANARRPRIDNAAALRRFVERADPAAEAIPRLSRDARQAEGHRCDRGRDTGSHACSHRARSHGSEQARLRAEAALLVGRGGACAGEEGEGETRASSRRWATRGTRATARAPATNTFAAAPSATCVRSTCGRIDRSASGRRGFRVRRRSGPARRAAAAAFPLGDVSHR